MTLAPAIYWLMALTVGLILHIIRDYKRYKLLKEQIERK